MLFSSIKMHASSLQAHKSDSTCLILSMMYSSSWPSLTLMMLLSMALLACSFAATTDRKVYVVYMGKKPSTRVSTEIHYYRILDQILDGISAKESIVRSYGRSFSGFAAKLTDQERRKLNDMEGVVSVFKSKTLKPQTTRSWDFLGFKNTDIIRRSLEAASDVIVGMIDTGIWPESESFSDHGLGPPPKRWKGRCENFTCNNKIIGARYYMGGKEGGETSSIDVSPRDYEGHGSHTASTAAGRVVGNVSLYGLAGGNARGAVPAARIAAYKVCWPGQGCWDHDLLAAFDDAIADGVDVISVSIGGAWPLDYFEDSIAIGSFHAMNEGILTSASAGNEGPYRGTVSNLAPWLVSVAASNIDRHFVTRLKLGDDKTVMGTSINIFDTGKKFLPFVYPESCYNYRNSSAFSKAKGKIFMCNEYYGGGGSGTTADDAVSLPADAGGVVIVNNKPPDYDDVYPLPALNVDKVVAEQLKNYISRTKNPVANIYKSEEASNPKAPVIASFSSRGPNIYTPNILKPDISAPGIDIIAAWSPDASLAHAPADKRSVKYNIISGTSMACPHVTGVAAYVKSIHLNWSPAAIFSAIVTTATPMDASQHADAELAHGAGQINPVRAPHPGLVYDAGARDYVRMLCAQGYDAKKIWLVTGDASGCSDAAKFTVMDLNYPSMAHGVRPGEQFSVKFSRTATNVGTAKSTYTAKIKTNPKVRIAVEPRVLRFESLNQRLAFVVTVSGEKLPENSVASAELVWFDGKHKVRSPIVAYTNYTM